MAGRASRGRVTDELARGMEDRGRSDEPQHHFRRNAAASLYRSNDGGHSWRQLTVDMAEECPNVRVPGHGARRRSGQSAPRLGWGRRSGGRLRRGAESSRVVNWAPVTSRVTSRHVTSPSTKCLSFCARQHRIAAELLDDEGVDEASTLKNDETGVVSLEQAAQIGGFPRGLQGGWPRTEPRVLVSREHFALVNDQDRALWGRGGDDQDSMGYAAEPDVFIEQLRHDKALAAAATLLLTVPNQLA